jgi:hypothetical protein
MQKTEVMGFMGCGKDTGLVGEMRPLVFEIFGLNALPSCQAGFLTLTQGSFPSSVGDRCGTGNLTYPRSPSHKGSKRGTVRQGDPFK